VTEPRYTVFEAANENTREIFVGMTAAPMFEAERALRAAPPAAIKHWDFNDVRDFRSVEFDLSEENARQFIEGYARTTPPLDWRFVIG
jgi:hypothetical protein